MDTSYTRVTHADFPERSSEILDWTHTIMAETPLSPQGRFLKLQLLNTLARCTDYLGDQQRLRRLGEEWEADTHGIQQFNRLLNKYGGCLRLEGQYSSFIEPFRRLNAERLMWRYGDHLADDAIREYLSTVVFHNESILDYLFFEWQSLFHCRRVEKTSWWSSSSTSSISSSSTASSATLNEGEEEEEEEMPASGLESQPTETLRVLTYLVRLEPSEDLYDALERWATRRVEIAGGQGRSDGWDDDRVDELDLIMARKDWEMCTELLGEKLSCYTGDFRYAIFMFGRDVLGEDLF